MSLVSYWDEKAFRPAESKYSKIGSKRRFGVELEYHECPRSETTMRAIRDQVIFGAKADCSVRAGEFVSPPLYGDEGIKECEIFGQVATENNFGVGSGAGYHLHLDMTNESIDSLKRIALAYHYSKDFWLGVVPSHRRDFTYSMPHRYNRRQVLEVKDSYQHIQFCSRHTRYSWVNWQAYTRHKTLEIRHHETVKDSPSIVNWIIAHTRFCDAMSEMGIGRITRIFGRKKPESILREVRAIIRAPEVSDHLKNRFVQFSNAA